MANEQNLKPCGYKLSREEAKKGGKASVLARRERKRLADALRDVLNERADGSGELTKGQIIIAKMVRNVIENPTADDVLKLQKILGEDVLKVDVNGSVNTTRIIGLSISEIRAMKPQNDDDDTDTQEDTLRD